MHFRCNKRKIGITNSKSRFQFENQKLILLCKVQRIMLALTKQLQRQKRLLFVLKSIEYRNDLDINGIKSYGAPQGVLYDTLHGMGT